MNRENLKRPNFLILIRFSLVFFLLLSSAAILYSTARNFRSAQFLAEQSLENTALALSSTAENVLRREGEGADPEIREIFSDRVVAYALIVNAQGEILFHTNPRRVGAVLSAEEKGPHGLWEKVSGRRITLGTGLPAYEFSYPLHLADGKTEWLRLILHTALADRIISDARGMWWIGLAVLALLWTVGILFERVLTRSLRLRSELEDKKRLALIGQMTSVLAHEIRNALGTVKGYAQWVDEKLGPADPKKAALTAVLQGTERIESLVRELLQFSRDESYTMDKVDIVPILTEVIQSATSGWGGTQQLRKDSGGFVNADKEKLRRVFINAIQNAVQAMGESGFLQVSVRSAGPWVRIAIEDTGPGIPEEQVPMLFTPFYTTKTDGTGLGLAYSKKVVEGMEGKISLHNRERERGAVLTIHLSRAGE